ncbi:MAG TPA: hypothetical protein DIT35_03415, partial [Rhodospirillaceae bacterium]|nr:hypothetical protein [Rhodospirillaceae bacterium]
PITKNGISKSHGALNGAITGFTAAVVGRAQKLRARPVVWIAPRTGPCESLYAPGLVGFGLDPVDLIAVRIPPGRDFAVTALWAMDEALRVPNIGLVCAEIEVIDLTASRRLQLAAETSGGLGLLLRSDTGIVLPPTACASRWRIAALPGGPTIIEGIEYPKLPGVIRWRTELLRARGGQSQNWQLEWRNDGQDKSQTAGSFALVPPLRDRSLPTEPRTPEETTILRSGNHRRTACASYGHKRGEHRPPERGDGDRPESRPIPGPDSSRRARATA